MALRRINDDQLSRVEREEILMSLTNILNDKSKDIETEITSGSDNERKLAIENLAKIDAALTWEPLSKTGNFNTIDSNLMQIENLFALNSGREMPGAYDFTESFEAAASLMAEKAGIIGTQLRSGLPPLSKDSVFHRAILALSRLDSQNKNLISAFNYLNEAWPEAHRLVLDEGPVDPKAIRVIASTLAGYAYDNLVRIKYLMGSNEDNVEVAYEMTRNIIAAETWAGFEPERESDALTAVAEVLGDLPLGQDASFRESTLETIIPMTALTDIVVQQAFGVVTRFTDVADLSDVDRDALSAVRALSELNTTSLKLQSALAAVEVIAPQNQPKPSPAAKTRAAAPAP